MVLLTPCYNKYVFFFKSFHFTKFFYESTFKFCSNSFIDSIHTNFIGIKHDLNLQTIIIDNIKSNSQNGNDCYYSSLDD